MFKYDEAMITTKEMSITHIKSCKYSSQKSFAVPSTFGEYPYLDALITSAIHLLPNRNLEQKVSQQQHQSIIYQVINCISAKNQISFLSSEAMQPKHIAALGSSFGSGPGIHPLSNIAAGRSTKNYANVLSQLLNTKLTDLTVSGATLQNVLDTPQVVKTCSFPPQLETLAQTEGVQDIDVVTLTGGGNDLGYIGGMIAEGLFPSFMRGWMLGNKSEISTEDLIERFLAVFDRVHELAPKAKILAVEYLTVLGADVEPGVDISLSHEQIERFQAVASRLNEAYSDAASRRDFVVLVNVAKESWAHGLGSEEPWVGGLAWKMLWTGEVPLHPNEEGMEAVARILERVVQSIEA